MSAPRSLLACVLSACALGVAVCGEEEPAAAPPPAAPAVKAADFPNGAGRTLAQLLDGMPEGPVLAPSVSLLDKGENRVAVALFDRARKQIAGAALAIYTARPDGSGLQGPYLARNESLAVKPQFESQTTSQDPDAATAIYVADVPFKRSGDVVVAAVAKIDGRLMAVEPTQMKVGATKGATPPAIGDKAPSVSTPTVASVAGDVASIDTRVPPLPDLHQEDFAKVLGKKPAVLLFATPQLCQSKVCGPVVDVTAQVKSTAPRDVAFIHMEIYNDNDISKGTRPQVNAYKLPTEPWAFVVDRTGKITARFEGAFSPQELQKAVDAIAGA